MGMSATQARYLCLVAQQSNLEYQGQQINQERSILSQQVSELYNSLLALEVPTPPSTSEFQTVQYAGKDGASNFVLGEIKPQGENYLIERKVTAVGDGLKARYGDFNVDTTNGRTLKVKILDDSTIKSSTPANNNEWEIKAGATPNKGDKVATKVTNPSEADFKAGKYFVMADSNNAIDEGEEGGKATGDLVPATGEFNKNATYYTVSDWDASKTFDANTMSVVTADNDEYEYNKPLQDKQYYIIEGDTVRMATANDFDENGNFKADVKYALADDNGTEYNRIASEQGALTIEGKEAMTWTQAQDKYPTLDWGTYATAIQNTYGEDSGITKDSFYVYITGTGDSTQVNFALQEDVNSPDSKAQVFKYDAAATYTKSEYEKNCKLEFDTSGRIIAMLVPNKDGNDYTRIALEASTVTDEKAYQDAYAKYEYAQYEYDKEQQNINIKTEKIQQQDRNLELRLQRLDTQRQQITTEIEALEKVLGDNIEQTYKTFSG